MLGKRKRILLAVLGTLVVIIAVGAVAVWQSIQHVPDVYADVLKQPPAKSRKASDAYLEKATALVSDARRLGDWEARFTAEQINGWLAFDLPRNHPDILPAEVKDPRISIKPGAATVFCRYDNGSRSAVLSLAVDVFVSEPDMVGLRLRSVKAGALPLPMSRVLDAISTAARGSELPLEWRQTDGDPVALFSLEDTIPRDRRHMRLAKIELRDGEILIRGQTASEPPSSVQPAARTGEKPGIDRG